MDNNTPMLFHQYCDAWMQAGKRRFKSATYSKYAGILDRYIKPAFGAYYPHQITTVLVDQFTVMLLDRLSPKSVRDILVILHSVWKYTARCYAHDHLPLLPNVEIVYPRETKKEMRVLSPAEQQHMISFLRENLTPCTFGILLSLGTGLRIGEICALRWDHVRLQEQLLYVDATMQRLSVQAEKAYTNSKKTCVMIGSPKSASSIRRIPLSSTMVTLCQQMKPTLEQAYVLTGTERYMEPRTLQYHLKKYTTLCGLEDVHFHTLRHTFATRCVEVGFDIKSLSEILGHANTTITLERYVHASMELKRSHMQKLSQAGL